MIQVARAKSCAWVAGVLAIGLLVCVGGPLLRPPVKSAAAAAPMPASMSTLLPASTRVDFARDVRPLFSEHCYSCHGSDPVGRKGEPPMRLDTPDGLVSPRAGGAPVVPGKPDESAIVLRITSTDDEVRMPPPGEGRSRLSQAQVEAVRRWIAQGAVVPPVRPDASFLRPTGSPPFPANNAPTPARVLLGKTLFFDRRLSRDGAMSCATCHQPGAGWSDGSARSVGAGGLLLNRRTPTLLNLAWSELLFWDGRSDSLEAQALAPIASATEMHQDLTELGGKLSAVTGYRPLFERAYPGEGINPRTVSKAIAAFERTLVSGPTPFDRWAAGDEAAVAADAKRGFALFVGKASCVQCHTGWNFTDGGFHDIGLPGEDPGRGQWLKDIEVVRHAFKTPTLRDVARRGPYMHDGSVATLAQVVELYDRGGEMRRPSLSPQIVPLGLSAAEKQDLVAFLKTLNGDDAAVAAPVIPDEPATIPQGRQE